ncbi:MAG: PilZ domain-containing protein [Nitrospirae bacterium]|nr:PilZ domain-containing protein [Nitrospirota bacterium]
MDLNVGEQIFFRIAKEEARYSATIVSANDTNIVIRANGDMPLKALKGDQLIISCPDSDFYTEILNRDNTMFSVKRLWCDRREFFRVDDVFPVDCRKIKDAGAAKRPKLVAGFGSDTGTFELPEDAVHPKLWNMLVDINTKLGMILERMDLQAEGFAQIENRRVNLSATGLKVTTREKAEVGDNLEIKMLLPTYPPIGILAFGRVVRVHKTDNDEYELALHFDDMDEDIRDEIIQYTLKRQRELIRSQREKEK